MSMPQKNGAYIARPLAMALDQKSTGSVQLSVSFKCDEYVGVSPGEPCNGEQITAYFNLVKKDGNLNEINVRSLKDSLGWDGASFKALVETDWSETPVQIVVDDETKQDGSTFKTVKYINPKDYSGGGGTVEKTDPKVIQSLDAKYGSLLRAMATPKASPKTGVAKPGVEGAIGKDVAWATFLKKVDEYGSENPVDAYTQDQRVSVFREVVAEIVKPKDIKSLTTADWVTINKQIEKNFDPATHSLIPF